MAKTVINPDPFCDVRLTNIKHNDRSTDKFMVELQRPDTEEFEEIPGVGTVHTADYQLVTNRQVFDMANQVLDDTGMEFKPITTFGGSHAQPISWNGKRFSSKWFVEDAAIDVPGGSKMMLGVEARNSYDGSCKVGLAFFAMHMVCSNQFYSQNMMGQPFVFPHVTHGGTLEEDISEALQQIRTKAVNFGRLQPAIELLQNTHMDGFQDFLTLRHGMGATTGLEFRDKAVLDELTGTGISHTLDLDEQPAYADPTSLWAIANAYTAVTTHAVGGMRGADHSSRAVDYLLNRAKELAA